MDIANIYQSKAYFAKLYGFKNGIMCGSNHGEIKLLECNGKN